MVDSSEGRRENDNIWADEDRCPRGSMPARIAAGEDRWQVSVCERTACYTRRPMCCWIWIRYTWMLQEDKTVFCSKQSLLCKCSVNWSIHSVLSNSCGYWKCMLRIISCILMWSCFSNKIGQKNNVYQISSSVQLVNWVFNCFTTSSTSHNFSAIVSFPWTLLELQRGEAQKKQQISWIDEAL